MPPGEPELEARARRGIFQISELFQFLAIDRAWRILMSILPSVIENPFMLWRGARTGKSGRGSCLSASLRSRLARAVQAPYYLFKYLKYFHFTATSKGLGDRNANLC
jgi:hypothetical protein